jgi:hypothetical protein
MNAKHAARITFASAAFALSFGASSLTIAAPPVALEPASATAPPAPDTATPPQSVVTRIGPSIDAGLRMMVLPNRGFDPYADGDLLPMVGIGLGVPVFQRRGFILGAHAEYDFGRSTANARDARADIGLHRIALGLEPHARIASRLEVFARLEGEAFHLRAGLDLAGQTPLIARAWTFGLETALGLSLQLTDPHEAQTARWYLTAQGGYSFAAEAAMRFSADLPADDPRRVGVLDLPAFKPQGAATRLGVAVAF